MTLLLRKQNAQDRIEGLKPFGWKDTDYAVLDDETRICIWNRCRRAKNGVGSCR
jgi:hypothetical protein